LGVGVGVGVGLGVGLGVGVGVGDEVGARVGVGVRVGVEARTGVGVGVGLTLGENTGVSPSAVGLLLSELVRSGVGEIAGPTSSSWMSAPPELNVAGAPPLVWSGSGVGEVNGTVQ